MEVIRDIEVMQEKLRRIAKLSVGMIQTKGALHAGHVDLIKQARKKHEVVILISLLHPCEFMSEEAYRTYPRSEKQDIELASLSGVDFFFYPDYHAIYNEGNGYVIKVRSQLATEMNGCDVRYGHKVTLLLCLLNLIRPQCVYVSDKDIQWVKVVEETMNTFHCRCQLEIVPRRRDTNGLVLSARHKELDEMAYQQALKLEVVLQKAKRAYKRGMRSWKKIRWHIENAMNDLFLCQLQFVCIVEPHRLTQIETITDEAILMIGIKIGDVSISDYIVLSHQEV